MTEVQYAYQGKEDDPNTWKLPLDSKPSVYAALAALQGDGKGNPVGIPLREFKAAQGRVYEAVKQYDEGFVAPVKKASLSEMIVKAISDYMASDVVSQVPPEVVHYDEEMVSYEIIYSPYSIDAHGQWMTSETIERAAENFNRNLSSGVVKANLFHMKDTDAFEIESTWIQRDFDVYVVQTGEYIPAGSWVAKLKFTNETLWNLKKSGILGGVSFGGVGTVNKETGEITNLSFDGEQE